MGDKVGVKLDPGTEGWLLARDALPFSWSAAAGTACKSGAPYSRSEQGYHHMLREGPRDSTSTPDKDNYNFPFKTELSADCLAHMLWQGCLSLLIERICLDLLEKYVSNNMRNALAGKKLYRAVNTVCSASEPTRNSHILMITTTMQAGSPDRARRKRTLELLVVCLSHQTSWPAENTPQSSAPTPSYT